MASRKLSDLSPLMQGKAAEFIAGCSAEGLDIVIICTYRDACEQQAAFDSGHSLCVAGKSAHNVVNITRKPAAEAFDVGVIRAGKYIGDANDPDYQRAGVIGESLGLKWAGRWTRFREVAHFQNPNWVRP